jgi:TIR domain
VRGYVAMPYDAFISYSRHDREFASVLARELGRRGTTGFLDMSDISAGAEWGHSIKAAIQNSDAVIVILSPEATTSNWVMAEVGMAQALNKPIIPVLAPGAQVEGSVSDLLRSYQIVNASELPVEEVSARIVAAMKGISVDAAKRLLPRRRRNVLWMLAAAAVLVGLAALYVALAT